VIEFPDDVLFADLESHSVTERYELSPRKFFRLGQYAWGEGSVHTTADYDEFIALIRAARVVCFHNGHQFDLSVLFGVDSMEPVWMARNRRILDTFTHATLVNPAPYFYLNEDGKKVKSDTPGTARRWFKLQNQAFQLGVEGKTMDLFKYAQQFTYDEVPVISLKTGKPLKATRKIPREGVCCGFGAIPVDDPVFVEYAEQDVIAVRNVARALLEKFGPMNDYAWREQLKAAIDAQISRNGWRVDQELAWERVRETDEEAAYILDDLHTRYQMPLNGKKPLASDLGKQALLSALHDLGVKDRYLARTDKGAISFSGDSVRSAVEKVGTPDALALGEAVATLAGQRSLPELALRSVHPDGKVHPSILPMQKSGRKCVPESHRVLTQTGLKSATEVIPGVDQTLDASGEWAIITDVHRYADEVTDVWSNTRDRFECTSEHNWVQRRDGGLVLEPLKPGLRTMLKLTPDTREFDLRRNNYPKSMTQTEQRAALIGLLVTDGRCAARTDSTGISALVYQTGKKFYQKMREVIPPELIASTEYREEHDHYAMRLYSNPVLDLLAEEGLQVGDNLRRSPSLLPWVLGLTERENFAFLTSVWLADGNTANAGITISCKDDGFARVVMIAGYRAGYRPSRQSYQEGSRVSLRRDAVGVRGLTLAEGRSDVWCVTTETGTWTAWNEFGPYLTGNSITEPGLTVWNARGPKARQKEYFIPNRDDEVLMEFDLSNADARCVAALSGDEKFAERFEPGKDGHMINAVAVFGQEVVDQDPAGFRDQIKGPGHAWSYRVGAKKLAISADISVEEARMFLEGLNNAFPGVVAWQESSTAFARRYGFVMNDWGRKMAVDAGREFTQPPALEGQSSTNEIFSDGLIRLPDRILRMVVITVHDALVLSMPRATLDRDVAVVLRCFTRTWKPKAGGQMIEFPLGHGTPGLNWKDAQHG
jgi:hypothetical protein